MASVGETGVCGVLGESAEAEEGDEGTVMAMGVVRRGKGGIDSGVKTGVGCVRGIFEEREGLQDGVAIAQRDPRCSRK